MIFLIDDENRIQACCGEMPETIPKGLTIAIPKDCGQFFEKGFKESMDEYILIDGVVRYEPTESQTRNWRIMDLKAELAHTDFVISKTMEGLIGCTNITDIIRWLVSITSDVKEVIRKREAWREEIKELEKEEEEHGSGKTDNNAEEHFAGIDENRD